MSWNPMETAPPERELLLKVEGFGIVRARLELGVSVDENEEACDQWQAVDDNHPTCWSDGACWTLNEEDAPSLQPSGWRKPTPV